MPQTFAEAVHFDIMHRPLGITISAILMVSNVLIDVVLSLTSPTITSGHPSPNGPTVLVMAVHLILVLFIVAELVVVIFYWLGKPAARWGVLFGCIFYLYGLREIGSQWHRNHAVATLTAVSGVLALYLIWYLYTREIRAWFSRELIAQNENARAQVAGNRVQSDRITVTGK